MDPNFWEENTQYLAALVEAPPAPRGILRANPKEMEEDKNRVKFSLPCNHRFKGQGKDEFCKKFTVTPGALVDPCCCRLSNSSHPLCTYGDECSVAG